MMYNKCHHSSRETMVVMVVVERDQSNRLPVHIEAMYLLISQTEEEGGILAWIVLSVEEDHNIYSIKETLLSSKVFVSELSHVLHQLVESQN